MKQLLLLFFAGTLLISCKSNQKSEFTDENDIEEIVSDEILTGKVIDRKRRKLSYVAIKLVIDSTQCMNAYTGEDGLYAFTINPAKIKDDSYFEVVYKGFVKKTIPYNEVVANNTIKLSSKGKVVTRTEYKIFYEEIRSCSR